MSVLQITKENFQQEVLQSRKPVLLDFWAGWCGPCRMLGPVIEQLAEDYGPTSKSERSMWMSSRSWPVSSRL